MSENNITKNYICGVLKKLKSQNLIYFTQDDMNKKPFVRRLRNLQHICQTIEAELVETSIIHGKFLQDIHEYHQLDMSSLINHFDHIQKSRVRCWKN